MSEFSTTRTIAASPEAVFAAIADPVRLARWWGPKDFANVFDVREFLPGGEWQFTMYGPGGKHFRNESRFAEISAPNTVVVEHLSQPTYRLSISLQSVAGTTQVSWTQAFYDAEVARRVEKIVVPANEQNLDRLVAEVARYPNYPEGVPARIGVEALVTAPLDKVWGAYTTPNDIMQWNAASDDWHTTAATVDLRVGGAFSSRMAAKDGSFAFDFAGTYTAVVEHRLIEYAFGDRVARVIFDPRPDAVRVAVLFDAETTHSLAQQQEGWQAILDRFKRHVEG